MWDIALPPAPGQPATIGLASLEKGTSPPQHGKGVLLLSGTVTPVLMMRGVRKEFHLAQVCSIDTCLCLFGMPVCACMPVRMYVQQ